MAEKDASLLGTQAAGDVDSREVISFLGPSSSYTHQATLACFSPEKYDLVPAVSIRDIFEAVQSGAAGRGVVPFENSTNGAVIFTLELLADRDGAFRNILVTGEHYLAVSHCLLGYAAPRSTNGSELSHADVDDDDNLTSVVVAPFKSASLSTSSTTSPRPSVTATTTSSSLQHVRHIYSHPQAFGQCEAFLGAQLKGRERIDVSSTSRAAEIVKGDVTGASAAVASRLAADIHGLDVLAAHIEDRADNKTRFLVIQRAQSGDEPHHQHSPPSATDPSSGPTKSLISFTVDHALPGALADVLDCFRRNKVNLTSINSRPTVVTPFQYIFFVEFEGSRLQDPEGRVAAVLKSLPQFASWYRWLGSWDDMLKSATA